MGNYGPTLDRWYHRAALVLWPQQHTYSILVQAGPNASVPGLAALLDSVGKAGSADQRAKLVQQARHYAQAIIEYDHFDQLNHRPSLGAMLKALAELGDPDLADEFFVNSFSRVFTGDEGRALGVFLDAFGWREYQTRLIALTQSQDATALRLAPLLRGLYKHHNSTAKRAKKRDQRSELALLGALAEQISQRIADLDADPDGRFDDDLGWINRFGGYEDDYRQRIDLIKTLLQDCAPLLRPAAATRLIDYFTQARLYPLHGVLIPLFEHYQKAATGKAKAAGTSEATDALVARIKAILQERTAQPVVIPEHWVIEANWRCNCQDCQTLREFIADGEATTMRVPMAKDRRRHMHQTIDRYVPDVDHETHRQGRPYTLIFKKNRNSYKERQKLWEIERKILQKYDATAPG